MHKHRAPLSGPQNQHFNSTMCFITFQKTSSIYVHLFKMKCFQPWWFSRGNTWMQ